MSDKKMSPELQIAIRRSPDYTAPSAEVLDLQVRLEAANKVALSALERAKKLQAEVDRMAPEFEAILAVNDGLRAEVAAKDAAYLGGAPTEAEALQMRLDAAEAEVAAWRRAIRWRTAFDGSGMHVMSIGTRDVVAAYAPYCAVRQNKSDIPAFLREHGLPDIGLGE